MYPFNFFNTKHIRNERLSDHQPVIENDILSWNIMMHCKFSQHGRYNNAFELIETKEQYQQRLEKIALILARLCLMHPNIEAICLQEAPVEPQDIKLFIKYCLLHPSLQKFAKSLQDEQSYTDWGLVSLFNSEIYQYQWQRLDFNDVVIPVDRDFLENRVQHFTLIALQDATRRSIINLHLPFDMSKKYPGKMARVINSIARLQQKNYCGSNIIAGDFNFLITQYPAIQELGNVFMPQNNSTEFSPTNGGTNSLETVDAIIRMQPAANEHNSVEVYTRKKFN